MSDVVLRVEGLAKRYRLGGSVADGSFREMLAGLATRWLPRSASGGGGGSGGEGPRGDFWALRDVGFEVNRGEVVGLIGRNGAGKSTLLKILSRVTAPTAGTARVRGRVGSLLEVGTGFHPELTGRENIQLNGSLLGMSRREVAAKFDDIVEFAQVSRFLDTPVKRYSSGMYVRLAFAVAAHLEPEVLLVDEVLAVGDAAFQKKCLGKMRDVAAGGRTVLFVSHHMAAVQSLCSRAILLDGGRVARDGPVREVVHDYFQASADLSAVPLAQRTDRGGDGSVRLTSIKIENAQGGSLVRCGSRLRVTIGYRSDKPLRHATFLAGIYDLNNTGIYLLNSESQAADADTLPAEGQVTCVTDPINLTPGRCYLNLAVKAGNATLDYVQHACHFDVEAEADRDSARMPGREWVMCLLNQRWEFETNHSRTTRGIAA